MKRICSFVLALGLIVSLSACGKGEITMQEVYDAGRAEVLLKNHESVYTLNEVDGVRYFENHVTKEYNYNHYIEYDWAEFVTDDVYYDCFDGEYARVLPLTPDGVADMASLRADLYPSPVFGLDTVYETIESVSKKDGRLTVVSVAGQDALENIGEGVASIKFEYVLDAKTYEVISLGADYTYDDGTVSHTISETSYDVEAPEMVKTFLEYANQTEDLRNVTVVTNPGTEKEISQSIQAPKGVLVGFTKAYSYEEVVELFADAACTEPYDLYEDTDSDLTIYVKWTE